MKIPNLIFESFMALQNRITSTALLLAFIFGFSGCETDFQPDLEQAEKILVIDAWVTQEMKKQEIRVYYSKPYFDNSPIELIQGAQVKIEDMQSGQVYSFLPDQNAYSWTPQNEALGKVGNSYKLSVTIQGETFEAIAKMGRVPAIDTITFEYKEKDLLIKSDYYSAEFLATDPQGKGDTYWIKAFKNGQFLSKGVELNMAYDAGFSSGQSVDGKPFISTIRKDFINPLDNVEGKNGEFKPPYLPGDKIRVEIHSIDQPGYEFLYQLYYQINRPGGFGELFSIPLANVPTNLESTKNGSQTLVAGFFNVSAVSSFEQVLTEEIAAKAKNLANGS
ncbi:DUF4249 domain-containing protein [Algoriphagus confluentis]|uniref:DUF4249 domain-containing protein n=1 Tax=Algoriphagus confluentis TaxID=1697556 RepID=A0ABQ6PRS5_9BACT|nr:hypothetical protein Aconfl_33320 [Algoriphagus confluentis]